MVSVVKDCAHISHSPQLLKLTGTFTATALRQPIHRKTLRFEQRKQDFFYLLFFVLKTRKTKLLQAIFLAHTYAVKKGKIAHLCKHSYHLHFIEESLKFINCSNWNAEIVLKVCFLPSNFWVKEEKKEQFWVPPLKQPI